MSRDRFSQMDSFRRQLLGRRHAALPAGCRASARLRRTRACGDGAVDRWPAEKTVRAGKSYQVPPGAIHDARKLDADQRGFFAHWHSLICGSAHPEAAIECLRNALRAAPDYIDAMFNFALLLQRNNKHAEAAEYWRHYLANDAQSEWATRARRSLKFCEMQIHLSASAISGGNAMARGVFRNVLAIMLSPRRGGGCWRERSHELDPRCKVMADEVIE
jgi:tetratricopeptide (TPR) repeat protein